MRVPTETVPVLRIRTPCWHSESGGLERVRSLRPGLSPRLPIIGISSSSLVFRRELLHAEEYVEVLRGASCYVSRSLEFCVRFLPCFLLAFRHETTPSGALLRVPVCETASFGRLVFNSTPRFAGTGLSRTSCNKYLRAPAYCVSPVQLIEKRLLLYGFSSKVSGGKMASPQTLLISGSMR